MGNYTRNELAKEPQSNNYNPSSILEGYFSEIGNNNNYEPVTRQTTSSGYTLSPKLVSGYTPRTSRVALKKDSSFSPFEWYIVSQKSDYESTQKTKSEYYDDDDNLLASNYEVDQQIIKGLNTGDNSQEEKKLNEVKKRKNSMLKDEDRYLEIINWNGQFQEIMNLPNGEQKSMKLASIIKDFHFNARKYGEVIISEKYLPLEKKTFKPVKMGGFAGGEVRKICFIFEFHFYSH